MNLLNGEYTTRGEMKTNKLCARCWLPYQRVDNGRFIQYLDDQAIIRLPFMQQKIKGVGDKL